MVLNVGAFPRKAAMIVIPNGTVMQICNKNMRALGLFCHQHTYSLSHDAAVL